ncbi:hydantoinase/oxoprolinase family protein [Haliangium sp.]|uniref:hydantoinase/oxoprolinase family protein n=1 Tax=Haliangium sp. TaxID=2663208 RepID=UPI003D109B4E
MSEGQYRIGIDTGGTFTDIVAVDRESGALHVTKVPSTPDDPSQGLAAGVAAIMGQLGLEGEAGAAAVSALCHGTTVATNALLEERFSSLGLITTRGFRHVLEIARQSVPEGYGNSYFWVKPDRIVPLELVAEVEERLDYRGQVIRPLDEDSVRAAGRFFRELGIEAVGVCLIHAYANGAHERRVREILAEEVPALTVSLSHEVLPEYREYERTMTTLVDAYVKPVMARYMSNVSQRLDPAVSKKPFLVMKSNGGVISAQQVTERPIATALSGPAAGALGAAVVAELAGFRDLVTVDAGGTSTDVCLIEDGQPHLTTNGAVGRFPVKLPMIDIVTVGTGGGSIAWCDAGGALRVGPKSAGAVPGPMCYPNGGDQPTITDANVVLGRIPPALIGGGIALDVDRARAGLTALGEGLGLGPEALAAGILEIANWSQANAIRQITIKRGIDPRGFALLSFGGSGPAQSAAVMDLLGMRATLIPPNPGNLSAYGLLSVDWVTDHIRTKVVYEAEMNDTTAAEVATVYDELSADAHAVLARDGVPEDRRVLVRHADVRYAGQAWEVRVDAPTGDFDRAALDEIVNRFHAAHERAYGYSYQGRQPVEIVNFAVSGYGRIERPRFQPQVAHSEDVGANLGQALDAARKPTRPVWFGDGFRDTAVYDRARLAAGLRIEGPAVIEEFGSTTVIFPGQFVEVDPHGILIVRPNAEGGAEATGEEAAR